MFTFGYETRRMAGLLACIGLIALLAAPVAAQTAVEQAPSLALVPEDAAVYGAMMHNKDVYEAIVNSNAYATIAEMDAVKPGLEELKNQWEENTGNPAVKGIVATILDGLSEEMFFYTDSRYAKFMEIYQEANAQGSVAMWMAAAEGGAPDQTEQLKAMLDVLANHTEELQVPDMVIGMRVKDADAAQGLVAFIKLMAGQQLAEAPAEIRDRFSEETVGGVKLISFKVDGSMLPWHEIPFDEFGEEGKYDSLVEKLKSMTVAISMGVKDNFLLISVGDSNEHIGQLGKGKGLAGRPEMAKLAAVNGKKLRSISYVSKEAAKLTTDSAMAPAMTMLSAVPELLPPEVDDMLRKQIEADVKELAKDLQTEIPEPGAMLNVATFSDRGFDTLSFNWTENKTLDSSQPLTLLNHVGGSPIAYFVGREKANPQGYDTLVKWLKKFDGYMTKIVEAEGGDQEAQYKAFRAKIGPMLARLDKANREMLRPALADGQSGMVLDAKITSTQWFNEMPESPHPLPMFELGMVFGVDNADLLKQGAGEYFAVANEMVKLMHEMDPDEFELKQLPEPKERKFGDATIWYYMLPVEMGIDKRIAPNAGVTPTAAAMSLAPLHTKRLLQKSDPALAGPVAQYKDKPLAMAGGFNFAALVDATVPWIEYGMNMGLGGEFDIQDFGDDELGGPDPMEYVRVGAELLKCFRGYSSVTYVEDGVTVTRGEWHFKDLE